MNASSTDIILAYRHLYQHLLKAVQYSKPARFVARDRVRDAFRKSPIESYDAQRIAKTLEFLNGATKTAGLEHKILKNWVHVWWARERLATVHARATDLPMRRKAYVQFDETIENLNETMGLCIK